MPSLGGGSVLRGYSTGRFRDRHALITTAEWRWFPNRTAFDVAFFFDAGTVAARRADLLSERMQTDWGIGGRFHGPFPDATARGRGARVGRLEAGGLRESAF